MAASPKICDHLQPLADHLLGQGHKITFAGHAWTTNCRVWIYFDTVLDIDALKTRFQFDPCIVVHTNDDTKSGTERGFVCNEHNDAVMGLYDPSRDRQAIK